MAAADDHRIDGDDATGRLKQAIGDDDLEREGRIDPGTSSVKHNIDRVADKVKGLLRSDG